MGLNKQSFNDRLKVGIGREDRILSRCLDLPIMVGNEPVNDWLRASSTEDISRKIDAWAVMDVDILSVQIKWRDDGRPDLGVAIVRPYVDHGSFQEQWDLDALPLDRDFVSHVDLYVCESCNGDIITVVKANVVYEVATKLLKLLRESNGFHGRTFSHPSLDGAMLKLVTDRGEGYSYGHQKIICYLEPWLLEHRGAYIWSV